MLLHLVAFSSTFMKISSQTHPGAFSMVIVNPVKLTLKFNYHTLLSTPKIAIFKDTCYYPYKLFRLHKKNLGYCFLGDEYTCGYKNDQGNIIWSLNLYSKANKKTKIQVCMLNRNCERPMKYYRKINEGQILCLGATHCGEASLKGDCNDGLV